MKLGVFGVVVMVGVVLAGCGSKAVKDTGLQAQAVALAPLENVVVASSRFLTCVERGEGVACFTCEIAQYDEGGAGIATNATYIRHEFDVVDSGYKHNLSTEISSRKLRASERKLVNAKTEFAEATRWCGERGLGTNYMLKDEMAKVFGSGL
ncbi:MAG: hypothetical protein L3J05_05685 [Robiginitomaculum sp.]|nr:hypothetical protein [Robiginitomaculum sp.]